MNERSTQIRCAASVSFLSLAMLGLGTRLAFLHIGASDTTRSLVNQRREIRRELLAGRGRIYDARERSNVLAMNLAVKDVCADPAHIVDSNCVAEVASCLGELLDLPTDAVAIKLNRPKRRFAYISRYVHEETVQQIRERHVPGVFFRDAMVRYYPHGEFMCHVLGFVNYEGVGSAGVEQFADRYLRGSPGLLEGRVNALRQEMYTKRDRYVPALKGGDLTLTIDQNVQFIAETALEETVRTCGAKGGWVIVQHVRTGRILALASRPGYDLNEFRTAPQCATLNRPIGYVYEPGSTMKAAIIAAALDCGTVNENTVLDCEHGAWAYGGRILHDFHPYGLLTVADGLKKSSNILTAKVALGLGDRQMHRYLSAFGLGARLGIDLPGEEAGILHPPDKWSKLSATRVAIGQGVAVTALQMLGLYCTIANDGFLMRPYVIKRVSSVQGDILTESQPEVLGRPISYETAARMRRLLARVTEQGGTGTRAMVAGYQVAGKTGTAQKPVDGGYSDTAHVASFVGFLPASEPEIGVIVVIDEPHEIHTGGRVAAPVFARIAEQTVRYLNIPPVRQLIAQDRSSSL